MKFAYMSESPGKGERKLVGFTVNHVRYGIDIMWVREIINPIFLVPVPSLPQHVLGVADHRHRVVPIIDLRRRFKLSQAEQTRRTKWIIIKTPNRDVGLEVDHVTQVLTVSLEQQRERLPEMRDAEEPWIEGVFQVDGGLVFELDVEIVIDPQTLNAEQSELGDIGRTIQ